MSDSEVSAVSAPKPRWFYCRDFAGVHIGPYSLVLYMPHEWQWYFNAGKYSMAIQVGPVGWFWFSGRMPF